MEATNYLPFNQEAEEALVGSVLINPGLLNLINVAPADFYLDRLGLIYRAILDLRENGMAIDFVTVSERLGAMGKLESIGGPAWLAGLAGRTVNTLNAESYGRIVSDYATRRRAIQKANELARGAMDLEAPIEETLANTVQALNKTATGSGGGIQHIAEWAYETRARIDETIELRESGGVVELSTGYPKLDRLIGGGLYSAGQGTYMLIAGPPGMGKSILCSNFAENLQKQAPGHFFSSEMKRFRFMQRSMSVHAKVSAEELKRGTISQKDLARLDSIMSVYERMNLFVSDSNKWTTAALRAAMTRYKEEHGAQWMIFDYLKLLRDVTGHKEEHDRERELGLRLLSIFRDLEIAGIVIHTMTKEGMRSKNASLTDVAGASGLLYDPDITLVMQQSTEISDSDAWQAIDLVQVKGRDNETKFHQTTLGKLFQYPLFITPDPASIPMGQYIGKKKKSIYDLGGSPEGLLS